MEKLQIAGGDGRLTAEELDSRVASALAARTFGELSALTADLPADTPTTRTAKDVLVFEHQGGKHAQTGRWVVPKRIDLRTKLSRVTLDFTDAVITTRTLRVDMEMAHGKLYIIGAPDIAIEADGLVLYYSKLKLRTDGVSADPRLRIELVGKIKHSKVIERRP